MLRLRSHFLLTFQHRAGVTPYTSTCVFAESCVFGKQSLGPFYCGSAFTEHSFSLSYGVILQSSLAIVLSLTLGFSPHPCVSIFGTGCIIVIARSFSWKLASASSVLTVVFHPHHAFGLLVTGFAWLPPTSLAPALPTAGYA